MLPGAQLVTPEAVVLDLPTASVGSRLLCRLLDVLLTLVVLFVLLIILGVAAGFSSSGGVVVLIVYLVGLLGVTVLYPALMEGLWGGRTVGKLVLGLRVVRTDGGPIGFGEAAVRAALGLVEVWGTLGALGTIFIFVSRNDQRLGDMAAGTVVLRERRGGRLQPVNVLVPPGYEQLVRTMDVGAMTPHDYELVRSFLVRWRDFGDAQRPVIAAKLAGPLWQRFRHPLPAGLGPEYYLACLGAAYQFRHPAHIPVAAPIPVETVDGQRSWGAPPPGDVGNATPGWSALSAQGGAHSESGARPESAPVWGNGGGPAEPGANGWSAPG